MRLYRISGDLNDDALRSLISIVNESDVVDSEKLVILTCLGGEVKQIVDFCAIANATRIHFICYSDLRSCGAFIALGLRNFSLSLNGKLLWHAFGIVQPYAADSPLNQKLFELAFSPARALRPEEETKCKQLTIETGSFEFVNYIPSTIRRFDPLTDHCDLVKNWAADSTFFN